MGQSWPLGVNKHPFSIKKMQLAGGRRDEMAQWAQWEIRRPRDTTRPGDWVIIPTRLRMKNHKRRRRGEERDNAKADGEQGNANEQEKEEDEEEDEAEEQHP